MARTGRLLLGLALAVAAIGCGGKTGGGDGDDDSTGDGSVVDGPIDGPDDLPIDAPLVDAHVDAPVDAAGCGTDLRLAGEYLDWDSTLGNPMGIGGSQWGVVGDPTRSATTTPAGSLVMCIDANQPSQITVSGAGAWIPALFLADPAVLSGPGSHFIMRGVKASGSGNAAQQFQEFGVQYNAAFAQILVLNLGTAIPLALSPDVNPVQRSFVNGDGFNDTTWSEGDTGKLTLFPNRPTNVGSVTLTSTAAFMGPTNIPIASGRFTIVVIRG
ncbi:MAG TPA: hypothetical protein VHE35_06925 [Kofleriaceae bacterium]|nr:hypothetical protein [Kofleriaceae bacterium]